MRTYVQYFGNEVRGWLVKQGNLFKLGGGMPFKDRIEYSMVFLMCGTPICVVKINLIAEKLQ